MQRKPPAYNIVAEVLTALLAKLGYYRLCWGTTVRQDEEMGWASYALLRIASHIHLMMCNSTGLKRLRTIFDLKRVPHDVIIYMY